MKRTKRILAGIATALLIIMYLATLICAIFDASNGMFLFKASVMCTVLAPVLIWGYTVIYRLAKGKDEQELLEEMQQMEAEKNTSPATTPDEKNVK